MKRHLPRVLSSFRSRIKQQKVKQTTKIEENDVDQLINSFLPENINLNKNESINSKQSNNNIIEPDVSSLILINSKNKIQETFLPNIVDNYKEIEQKKNLNLQLIENLNDNYLDLIKESIKKESMFFLAVNDPNYTTLTDNLTNLSFQNFTCQVDNWKNSNQPFSTNNSLNSSISSSSENKDLKFFNNNKMAMGRTTPVHSLPSTSNVSQSGTKINYIIEELLNTEQTYVKELESLVEFYLKPFKAVEHSNIIPTQLKGQSDVIFGNIYELAEFHRNYVLAELQNCENSVSKICNVLVEQKTNFLTLYKSYCQNKLLSESLRNLIENSNSGEQCKFFLECQQKAGHLLPLSAYLLKPIQRITKYQLLLKELLRCCDKLDQNNVQFALSSMLNLVSQLNANMQQLHILGFAGDLRLFGPLRLQTKCEVYLFKRKSHRLANKSQKRHLFLFDGGVLFCKMRTQPVMQYASEYYEHKLCIPIRNLGFTECSKWSADRFELWDESRNDGYAIKILDQDKNVHAKWIAKLARLTTLYNQQQINTSSLNQQQARRHSTHFFYNSFNNSSQKQCNTEQQKNYQVSQQLLQQRPQSWTSDGTCSVSNRSSIVVIDENSSNINDGFVFADSNENLLLNKSPIMENNLYTKPKNFSIASTESTNSESKNFNFNNKNSTSVILNCYNNLEISKFCDEINLAKNGNITSIQIPLSKSFQNTTEDDKVYLDY